MAVLRQNYFPAGRQKCHSSDGEYLYWTFKETSLAFTIGVAEMFAQGKMIASANYKYFETYLAVGIVYWVLTIIYSFLQDLFERKISKPYRN